MRTEPHLHVAAKARLLLTAGRAALEDNDGPPARTLARRSAKLSPLSDFGTLDTWTLAALTSLPLRRNWFHYAAAARLAHDLAGLVTAEDRQAIADRIDAPMRRFALENRMLAQKSGNLAGDALIDVLDATIGAMETVWRHRLPPGVAALHPRDGGAPPADEPRLQACLYAAEVHLRQAGGILV